MENRFLRLSSFSPSPFFSRLSYRINIFLGSSPPHQATVFSPSLQATVHYNTNYYLAADLELFLHLRHLRNLSVYVKEHPIINLSDQGVSNQQLSRRLTEVISIYYRHYSVLFIIPYISRYLRRLFSRYSFKTINPLL